MEPLELDVALEEVEIRLERLRALYEQYFLGIEKIEPAVARKDVDRRIYVLRREKIRNTAKRFKLQTIIQRYNTFQQYWQRICREIENGTYKRHLLRAERTLGGGERLTIAARKRLGHFARISQPPPALSAEPAESSEPAEATEHAPPKPEVAAEKVAAAPQRQRLATGPAKTAQPAHFESLDLDMDFLGDWDPSKAQPRGKPAAGAPTKTRAEPPPPLPVAAPPKRTQTLPGMPSVMPSVPAEGAPEPKPEAPRPRAVPPPKPQRPPSRPEAAPAPSLSEDRVRELHSRLVEAKRQTNDGVGVSLRSLEKTLKATEAKLREQHKNRRIDFDVVIKDGKAVVKPIVR